MYDGVPTDQCRIDLSPLGNSQANPKSMRVGIPFQYLTLSGLISRCITFLQFIQHIALIKPCTIEYTLSTSIVLYWFSNQRRVLPSQCSNKIQQLFSDSQLPKNPTMFGCFSLRMIFTSAFATFIMWSDFLRFLFSTFTAALFSPFLHKYTEENEPVPKSTSGHMVQLSSFISLGFVESKHAVLLSPSRQLVSIMASVLQNYLKQTTRAKYKNLYVQLNDSKLSSSLRFCLALRFLLWLSLWFWLLFTFFPLISSLNILLLLILEPSPKLLFIIRFSVDQLEVFSRFRMRIDGLVTLKMNEILLNGNNLGSVFKIPTRISLAPPCVWVSLKICSKLTIVNHFSSEVAFFDCLFAFFTFGLAGFSGFHFSLPVHLPNSDQNILQSANHYNLNNIKQHQHYLMSSQQFRRLLEQFYIRINTSEHADVYKKMLNQQFDQVEVEPIHILTLTQQPTFKNGPSAKKQIKKAECLYKSTDFASAFLFGFLLKVLKNGQRQFLKELQKRVMDNLDIFYGQKQSEDSTKYKFLFEGIFNFCQMVVTKKYQTSQIQKLFKSFYLNTFERRGLKKIDREKFLTEAQVVLSFFLGRGGNFPSKKQVSQPTSDIYELNNLQFCINIQNMDENEEWTIGEGESHINIAKEKNEYYIYEDLVEDNQVQQQQISEVWQSILRESLQIKKSQQEKTPKIFIDLNIAEISSPAKSMRSPKSAQVKYGIKKAKIGDFF